MAIYHHSTKVVSRRSGKSATGAAAYRSAEKIVDERTGIINDYTRKLGVEHTEILTPIPPGANTWLTDRAQLWNKVEATEKRYDAQLAREINIAIPTELDRQDRIDLVREYIQTSYVDRGMVADICFHDFQSNNPHAHIMLTMRELKIDDQGVINFGNKQREWNDRNLLTDHRREWAEIANKYLENAGYEVRIDHRSLVEQGITDRLPQIHLGANVAAMKERGIPTDRGDIYDQIATTNLEIKVQLERVYQSESVLDIVEKSEAAEQERQQAERDETLIRVGLAYPEARDADFHAAIARKAERNRQRQESNDKKKAELERQRQERKNRKEATPPQSDPDKTDRPTEPKKQQTQPLDVPHNYWDESRWEPPPPVHLYQDPTPKPREFISTGTIGADVVIGIQEVHRQLDRPQTFKAGNYQIKNTDRDKYDIYYRGNLCMSVAKDYGYDGMPYGACQRFDASFTIEQYERGLANALTVKLRELKAIATAKEAQEQARQATQEQPTIVIKREELDRWRKQAELLGREPEYIARIDEIVEQYRYGINIKEEIFPVRVTATDLNNMQNDRAEVNKKFPFTTAIPKPPPPPKPEQTQKQQPKQEQKRSRGRGMSM